MRTVCDMWLEEMEAITRGRLNGVIEECPARLNGKPVTVWKWRSGSSVSFMGSTKEVCDWTVKRSLATMARRVGNIPWG